MESFKIKEKIEEIIEKYSKEKYYEIRKEKNKIYIYDSSENILTFKVKNLSQFGEDINWNSWKFHRARTVLQ